MSTTVCPSAETLKSFSVGNLSGLELDRVATHVADCDLCESALQQLDDYADGLVSDLQAVATGAVGESNVPRRLLAVARSAGVLSSDGTTSSVSLDPGRSYARRLEDGPCSLGKFELEAELGVGTFGYVFRARDSALDRTVAIKIQRAGSFASDEEANRFLREARSAAQLKHPNIVSLYETGQTEDGICFLVTEYVQGQTLEEWLETNKPTIEQSANLVAEIAEALNYAHGEGVIHRDLKPANIMIDHRGQPHIMDFGLAKRETADSTMTADGQVMGTPAYMSPEQARGESHDVDARSDIYSLGVILYELITGERPFQGNRRMLLLQVLEDEPRAARQLNDKIPRDLETICAKAMSKATARRYRTAHELADDLERFARGDTILARPLGYTERLWRWCRRYPLAAGLVVAMTFGSVAGFLYLSNLSTYFVHKTALDGAHMEADMLEQINAYYSEDVVGKIDREVVPVTHKYKNVQNSVPLPATFMLDASQRISEIQSGMQVRLYSDYPFRKDGGPKDDFEKSALAELTRIVEGKALDDNEGLAIHEFTTIDDRPVLRYARGWRMKQSCIDCHNRSEQSPKRDWEKGDLSGVLAITRPLDKDIQRTNDGLRGAFIVMGTIAASVVGLCAIFLLGSKVKNR